jgi:TM2 domain-containing membrane protein YozV
VPFVQQPAAPTSGQPVYQQQPASQLADAHNKKVAAGLFAILLGFLGIHKFILGYHGAGWVYLGIFLGSWCCFFLLLPLFASPIMGTIALIEGIIYLTKTDEQFYHTYMVNRRSWF